MFPCIVSHNNSKLSNLGWGSWDPLKPSQTEVWVSWRPTTWFWKWRAVLWKWALYLWGFVLTLQCKNCRTFAWYPQITGELLGVETAHIWCEKCCEYRNIFLDQPSIQKMCLSGFHGSSLFWALGLRQWPEQIKSLFFCDAYVLVRKRDNKQVNKWWRCHVIINAKKNDEGW